ncbi:GNAT family N-acetyltransferase [Vibrio sp. 10N.222.54.A1]|jgi:GNAT superfamily N-acetyltransferase|uniref:GNAT family N-acetyltransferase n=1 Tax=unclassified Vibrio TaxID=2614977 RepID=UPI000C816349|nr:MULTISPECIES: GNAT family N-acetyltransferase [unclassified Vibrio]PMK08357.1 GNAT family N-acetyltransferase [Vibrio sp. 10N.261.54.E10]PMK78199.1 GNAT family N-acetyltransferase [Vibrio sp. 10N.261.52.E5]TKF82867.1 GNAT family N-acetyltransferase [Vibrio sp. F13]
MAISFETQRLKVEEVAGELTVPERSALLERVPGILIPSVVENLPPYFHGIVSGELAEIWLDRMLSESRLLQVKSNDNQLIGFLFAYVEDESDAHIGYLLAEECWGKGFASELLQSFITEVAKTESWSTLIGGVDRSNIASTHLLNKLGFVEQASDESAVVFYEYKLSRLNS